jgi:hypothetical protein
VTAPATPAKQAEAGKHTPGPWDVAPLNERKYYGTEVADADSNTICTLWNHEPDQGAPLVRLKISPREEAILREPGMDDDAWEDFLRDYICDSHHEEARDYANARLIAAAPDLVEALSNLMRRLDDHFGGPNSNADWKEQEAARAALAKAGAR